MQSSIQRKRSNFDSCKELEDEVQFMIKDTGSGISKNILDHIFEEFVTDTNVSMIVKKELV